MARVEPFWLVKSSGRILGPFLTEKIADLLKTREISVLDEVSDSLRRWQTIQYHTHFKEIVDNMRKASLSEKTEATWTPGGAGTMGLTQTLTDISDSDLTEEVTMDLEGFNTHKEIVIHDVREQSQLRAPETGGRYQAQHGGNTAINRQVERTTRGLWIVTIVVLLAVIAFIVQRRYSGGQFEGRLPVQNLKQSVVNLVQIGHYSEALRELKNYYPDPVSSGDLAIYYGSLFIQVEGQTVMGRRLLNLVLASKRPEVKQAHTGLGVADLLDGQFDSAETNFEKALAVDPDYVPAILNVAALSLQKGDYRRSKNLASRTLALSPFQGEAMLLLAEAQLYLSKGSGSLVELAPISRTIRDFQERQWDYHGEVGFYGLYFDFLRREKGLEEKIERYLDTDPRLTQDHRHNVFIYKGRTSWKVMGRFCEQMVDKLQGDPRVAALHASCLAREGKWDAARKAIEMAVHQSPKDPLIQAWYAYVLRESGDADQSSVILARATDSNRKGDYRLPTLLQARFSQANDDVENAKQSWQKLYERDMNYLPSVAGLAWVNTKTKSFGEASKLIDKGLRISPDYIPLLELRQKGELEGWYGAR
jgi:tetratricopeptide (TPR) repeat protein